MPPPPAADAQPDPVEALLAICLQRMESEGPAALEALCQEHPQHADVLRRRMTLIESAGFMDRSVDGQLPDRLGEFELIRRIGSGGMGVVYLARQATLDREVALKLVRPEQMFFPGARERFRREVDAIARLQHPGIVAVHAVGEAAGIPYFAMEHVAGASLAEVLRRVAGRSPRELSGAELRRAVTGGETGSGSGSGDAALFTTSWVNACLLLMRGAAEAVDHAHARGVLHRDLKPSNLMVTRAGRVVVLDFGLATSTGADPVTRSGQQVGSLPYMAPEQLRGDSAQIDARTDVYALGVTLYELLTLRPPYLGRNAEATRNLVFAGEPVRPRRLNPAVPWEVETVCLKAMDSDLAQRYGSAAELVQDLDNCLGLRPIRASRPGLIRRGRRFVQRHPAWATAWTLGALLLAVAPTVYLVTQQRAWVEVHKALQRAQASSLRARRAVDELLTQVAGQGLTRDPFMDQARQRLLERAIELYRELAGELDATDPAELRELAAVHAHIAQLFAVLGRGDQAQAALARAADLSAGLRARTPADPEAVRQEVQILIQSATVQHEAGAADAALRSAEQALALIAEHPGVVPPVTAVLAQDRRGLALLTLDQPTAAAAPLDQAIAQAEARLAQAPADTAVTSALSSALAHRAASLVHTGDADAAVTMATRALQLADQTRGAVPETLESRSAAHTRRLELARVLILARWPAPAIRCLDTACVEMTRTVDDYPDYPAFRLALAQALLLRGELYLQLGSNAYADADGARAVAQLDVARRGRPTDPLLRGALSQALALSAAAICAESSHLPARQAAQKAQELATALAAEAPDQPPALLTALRADCVQLLLDLKQGEEPMDGAAFTQLAPRFQRLGRERSDELRLALREMVSTVCAVALTAPESGAATARLAQLLLDLPVRRPEDGLTAAVILARCGADAEPQALAAVREALAAGLSPQRLAREPALAALRDRPDFPTRAPASRPGR